MTAHENKVALAIAAIDEAREQAFVTMRTELAAVAVKRGITRIELRGKSAHFYRGAKAVTCAPLKQLLELYYGSAHTFLITGLWTAEAGWRLG